MLDKDEKWRVILVGEAKFQGKDVENIKSGVLVGKNQNQDLMVAGNKLGGTYHEVKEKFSTISCSTCSSRTGPSGLRDLGVREWTCSKCQMSHDRDVNTAKNILSLGHQTLIKGIPSL